MADPFDALVVLLSCDHLMQRQQMLKVPSCQSHSSTSNGWTGSFVLTPLAGRSEKPVLVKYDPRDLSRVYFRDDDGEYWEIPYRDLGLPPIALWEHDAATRQLQAEGRRAVDEKVIFEIVEEQRRLAEGARKSTHERRAAQRRRHRRDFLPEAPAV